MMCQACLLFHSKDIPRCRKVAINSTQKRKKKKRKLKKEKTKSRSVSYFDSRIPTNDFLTTSSTYIKSKFRKYTEMEILIVTWIYTRETFESEKLTVPCAVFSFL